MVSPKYVRFSADHRSKPQLCRFSEKNIYKIVDQIQNYMRSCDYYHILLLREQSVECHKNGMFVGGFCYADDVTLQPLPSPPPPGIALNACICFADAHDLLFNSSKTKGMFIDMSCSRLHSRMGRSVEFVNSVDILWAPLYADLKVNHMHRGVQQKFYCKVNNVLFYF